MQGEICNIACVYSANTCVTIRHLWRNLDLLTGVWCILGDFNVVLLTEECFGGSAPNQVSYNEILDWMNYNNLSNMFFSCAGFTWSNWRRGQQIIESRLDRALSNKDCLKGWSSCKS